MRPDRTVRAALVLALCIAAAGCAPSADSPASGTPPIAVSSPRVPALPAHALDAPSTPMRVLSELDVVDEASAVGNIASDEVEAVLDDAGFVAGAARSFAVPGLRVRTVLARVLRFGTTDGARRFVAWVRANVAALAGRGHFAPTESLPAPALVFVHEPGGCCAKEQATATAVWTRGALALSVQAVGAVGGADAVRFATELDGAMDR